MIGCDERIEDQPISRLASIVRRMMAEPRLNARVNFQRWARFTFSIEV
jgi:hypothetical protein